MSYDCKGNTRMRGGVSRRQWCFKPTVSVALVKPRADVTTEPSASLMRWEGAAELGSDLGADEHVTCETNVNEGG
jgi:hypothetical protein